MRQSRNLAARAGRWSARHRRAAILGWLGFVMVAIIAGSVAGLRYQREEDMGSGDSGHADRVIAAGFEDHASEQVLVQSRNGTTVDDPAFRAAIEDVNVRLRRSPVIANLRSPLAYGHDQLSRDKRSALVQFDILGDSNATEQRVVPILAQLRAAQAAHPGFRIEELGDASVNRAISEAFSEDARRAEFFSLPVTLIILVVAFATLVAAGLPLLLGLTAVFATIGLIGPVSHLLPVGHAITSVVLLVGLAVGVDYSMFYIRRERDERAAGRSREDALEVAAATSGRAVLISGGTVIVAMAGMFVIGHPVFQSFAVGTIMVVAVAVLGSLTVLPAVLAALGDRIDKGRVPVIGRRRRTPETGAWAFVVERVLRRPWLAGGMAAALLVVLALPALRLHTAEPGVQALPGELQVVKNYDRIQDAFPGGAQPALIAVRISRGRALSVALALDDVNERALATGLLHEPFGYSLSPDRSVGIITMAVAGKGTDATSNRALAALRRDVVPQTLGRLPGVEAHVTGPTAISKDFNDLMRARAPWVFVFVLSLAFLLLLVTFRSLVIPVTAIALNLLSVGAAYGVLVWIFQDGHLESVLGFTSVGGITAWLPLFLFVILFGLSMDYHVFILSRVREAFDSGRRTDDAVAHAIRSTAGVVTSAAIVMVAVFGIFAALRMLEFKQMGVGLAMAVLIDATIIRGVLLPATMKLLGDWNWYLPRWLEWLPRVGAEPLPEPAITVAPAHPPLPDATRPQTGAGKTPVAIQ